jgi:hypothetical protein
MGVRNQCNVQVAFATCKSTGTNCIGYRVDPGAGLVGCRDKKIPCPHGDLNPEPSSQLASRYKARRV